jgi:hypothetical protein
MADVETFEVEQAKEPVEQERTRAKGGNVILIQPGRGFSRDPNHKPEHGAIVFQTAELEEVLRMNADGEFVVHGQVVANDKEVFDTFRGWLYSSLRQPVFEPTKLQSLPTTAPAGTRVVVVEDDFSLTLTDTRSEPWPLGSGHWVVLLVGRTGGFSIDRVYPAP